MNVNHFKLFYRIYRKFVILYSHWILQQFYHSSKTIFFRFRGYFPSPPKYLLSHRWLFVFAAWFNMCDWLLAIAGNQFENWCFLDPLYIFFTFCCDHIHAAISFVIIIIVQKARAIYNHLWNYSFLFSNWLIFPSSSARTILM